MDVHDAVRVIPVGLRHVALVDAEDYDDLVKHTWSWSGRYAYRLNWSPMVKGVRRSNSIFMHRAIKSRSGYLTDHVNGDSLDNRKENLRFATNRENSWNSRRSVNNTSGRKGVSWSKRENRWRAYIVVYGKQVHLGFHDDLSVAADAYKSAAEKYFGKFARVE